MAYADDAKHAIPSITKLVSLDGKRFTESVQTSAGNTVHYRVTLSMPESADALQMLEYTVRDTPDSALAIDSSTVAARVVAQGGSVKVSLKPALSRSGRTNVFSFGNLKRVCDSLSQDDRLVLEYDALVASSAAAGEYPNIAKLLYDLGEKQGETVEVMSKVIIPKPVQTKPNAQKLPKTGDMLAGIGLASLALAFGSALVAGFARKRRE